MNVANAQWQQTSLNSGNFDAIVINDGNIYAAADDLFLSTDYGNSWTSKGFPYLPGGINTFVIKGNNIILGTFYGVYLSTINDSNWTTGNTGLVGYPLYINSLFVKDSNIYLGSYGIYMSTNNGSNWIGLDTALLKYSDIDAFVVKDSIIFAGVSNEGGVYLSTNNGISWTNSSAGLNANSSSITSLAIFGNYIIAGTLNNGVFLSPNNGSSWIASYLQNVKVKTLLIYGNTIFAGCDGDGVLISNDGYNWAAINSGLDYPYVSSLGIAGGYLFAGTMYNGVWKRPLSEIGIYGIKDNFVDNNISIYPNPTKDNLTIETNANQEQRLEILNLFGQTVYTNSINKKAVVNTSAFANGVYILKIYSDKETIVRKFIKE